jgi:hypothetical protein
MGSLQTTRMDCVVLRQELYPIIASRGRSEGEKESIIKYHRATINASGENFPVMHIYEIFRVKDNLDRLVFIVLS